jgi:hypothetical protein
MQSFQGLSNQELSIMTGGAPKASTVQRAVSALRYKNAVKRIGDSKQKNDRIRSHLEDAIKVGSGAAGAVVYNRMTSDR